MLQSGFQFFLLLLKIGHVSTRSDNNTAVTQSCLESLVLRLKVPDELVLGRFVDGGLVLNLLGSVGVPQSVDRLVVVGVTGSDSADHDGRGVTSKSFLKHAGQVGVTVGNVRAWLGLSSCDVSKR